MIVKTEGVWLNLNEIEFQSEGSCQIEAYLTLNFEVDKIYLSEFYVDSVEFIDDLDIIGGLY